MELIDDYGNSEYELTPVGVLTVVLRGDYDLAVRCITDLYKYADGLPKERDQVSGIAFTDRLGEFVAISKWEDDGSVM